MNYPFRKEVCVSLSPRLRLLDVNVMCQRGSDTRPRAGRTLLGVSARGFMGGISIWFSRQVRSSSLTKVGGHHPVHWRRKWSKKAEEDQILSFFLS